MAKTFGALPAREPAFGAWAEARERAFTAKRGQSVIRHTGDPSQATLRLIWPTRDDADPLEALELELLERVTRIELIDGIREALGKSYSPSATSGLSRTWRDYGTFSLSASVDVADVAATRAAMAIIVRDLRARPISADIIDRARAPLLEEYDNALKRNSGWLALADRAQSRADRVPRFTAARERLARLTAKEVQAMALRYLVPGREIEIVVLPEGVPIP